MKPNNSVSAVRVQTTNATPTRRMLRPKSLVIRSRQATSRFRPAVEVCEQRLVMSAGAELVKSVGLNVAQTFAGAAAGPLGEIAFGFALSALGVDSGDDAKFQAIETKIDEVSSQIADLGKALSTQLSDIKLTQVTTPLMLNTIDSVETTYKTYLSTKNPAERAGLINTFMRTAAPLETVVTAFENAFKGRTGESNLMQVYQQVAANSLSGPGQPFLDSSYTTAMTDYFRYIKDYEGLAVNLLAEYYHRLAFQDSTPTKPVSYDADIRKNVSLFQNHEKADEATLPDKIPSYALFDTRTGFLWGSKFTTGDISAYRNTLGLKILNGDTSLITGGYFNDKAYYGYGNATAFHANHLLIHNDPSGLGFKFHWAVPVLSEVTALGKNLSGSGTEAQKLVADGFAPTIFTTNNRGRSNDIWTKNYEGSGTYAGMYSGRFQTFNFATATTKIAFSEDTYSSGGLFVASAPGYKNYILAKPWK